jgi:glycosyltransferase involved in cell wall biosynthesis
VFAAGFGHGTGRELRIHGWGLARTQVLDGVRFVWLRTYPYRRNDWRRMLNMATFAVIVVVAQFGRPRPDTVIGSTVHPFAALAGWVIARLRGARFFYEIRDLWPQTLIDLGAMAPTSGGARAMAAIEGFLVHRAEIVIALLPGIASYLENRGLRSDHVRYLPNGVDLTSADEMAAPPRTRRPDSLRVQTLLKDLAAYRAAGEVIFAYAGALGRVNRLDVVLRALVLANLRSPPPIRLLLVGDGPEKAGLERLAVELQLKNVDFIDPVPKDRLFDLLGAVDVGVVHATATPIYRFGVSFNKVFDYMAARKPIAFACTTYADPVAAAGAGRSVAPDDPDALADAMVALATASPEERQRLGNAGRAFVAREHDFAKIGSTLADLIGCARTSGGG